MDVIPDDQTDLKDTQMVESTEVPKESEEAVQSNVAEIETNDSATTSADVPSSGAAEDSPKTSLPLLVPSLKGKMIYEGGNVTCKGVWGMSDLAHTQPGQVSDFELKLVKADDGSSIFPVNGRYHGWFHLKQAPPAKGSVKIEDKEMMMTFTKADGQSHYVINGTGHNKFGSFTLKGTLSEDGDVHMYREYFNLTPLPAPLKRRQSIDSTAEPVRKRALTVKTEDSGAVPPPPAETVSPRESSGRVRKQSSLMKEYIDTTVKAPVPTPKPMPAPKAEKKPEKQLSIQPPLQRQESASDRAHRLPAPLKKCSELLKELAKHPHAAWFLEPVDPIRLGIPDYLTIITRPMDFGTIRKRIESNHYDAIEGFADDMRLVFRNALTFNTMRDNPVNIAAREMSSRFEERFRVLTSQLGGTNAYSAGAILALEGGKTGSAKKSSGGSKTPRSSLGGATPAYPKASSSAGPRVASSGNLPYLPPAIDGSSAHQLAEMQRLMQAMQQEISTLKSQVRENEIVKRLQETKDASHNPLSFEEKKTLIAQIHKLPADKMPHVLNIIQSALPPRENDEEGDIEVPLDALDTFTLRKLQKFIEENSEKKKRAPGGAQRHSTAGAAVGRRESFDGTNGSAPKKARKSTSAGRLSGGGAGAGLLSPDNVGLDLNPAHDLELFESSEDMLFEPDSFEELKAHAQRDAVRSGANNSDHDGYVAHGAGGSDLGEEPEDFSALLSANSNHHSAAGGASEGGMQNLDAWK